MPSDAEMIAYGKSLPAIYRDIFFAFPAVERFIFAMSGLRVATVMVWRTRPVSLPIIGRDL